MIEGIRISANFRHYIRLGCDKTIECINCNKTELTIPDGIMWVYCYDNDIQMLNIPSSVIEIACDLMNGIEEQYNKKMMMDIYQKR